MAGARPDKQAANGGPDFDREDKDPRQSDDAKKRKLGVGRQTLAQHLPHITVQHDHAAVDTIRRAARDKTDPTQDVKQLKSQVTATTQGATNKMASTLKQAAQHPLGQQSKTQHDQHAKDHQQRQTEAHGHAAQARAHAATAHHEHGGGGNHGGNPSAHDGVDGIQFKKISDWSKYSPQPLPDQDERERKRILKLTQKKIEKERHGAAKQLAELKKAQLKAAGAVRAMKAGLQGQISSAQSAALGKVSATESSQAASVQSHVAGVQASVRGQATSAKQQVTAAHQATIQQINQEAQTATQKLTQGHQQALQQMQAQEQQQHQAVTAKFTAAKSRITALGSQKAGEASALPDQIALPYDGDKLDAAKNAAHDVGSKYAEAMPEQASKAATDLGSHEGETQTGVTEVTTQIKEKLEEAFNHAKEAIQQTKQAATDAANKVKDGAIQQIDQTASSTCSSLASFGAQQVAGIHQQASSAKAGITKAGQAAIAGVGSAVDKAATGLTKGAKGLQEGAKEIEVADPGETKKHVAKQAADLKQSVQGISTGLHKNATDSAGGLAKQADGASSGITQAATAANTQATQMGAQANQGIAQMAQGAKQNLKQVGDGAKKQLDKVVEECTKGFDACVKGQAHAYSEQLTKLQTGLDGAINNVQQSFDKAVPAKETEDILANAKKAADAVKPWWQKALAFVVSIVVAVVVVIAVTALIAVSGPVGMILVGALAGALSTVLSTMASNLILGNNLFDGITLESVAIGALGGAIGGGLTGAITKGALGTTIAKTMAFEGIEGLGGFAIRTGVNTTVGMVSDAGAQMIVTGKYEFTMQNFVTTLVSSAAMSTKTFDTFSKGLGDQVRTSVGLDPLHIDVNPGSTGSGSPHGSAPEPGGSHPSSAPAHEPGAPAPAQHPGSEPAGSNTQPAASHENTPAPTQPHDNTPAPAAPRNENQPAGNQPHENQPAGNQPHENQPAGNQPHENQPAGNQPHENQPAGNQPHENQPAGNQPHENQPAGNQPHENQPAGNQPHENQPAGNQPHENQPAGNQPHENQPAGNQPHETQPTNKPQNQNAPHENQPTARENNQPGHENQQPGHENQQPHENQNQNHEQNNPHEGEQNAGGEHEASATDSALEELGYPNASPEERTNAESKLRQNETPEAKNLRDTEANQRGREALEQNQTAKPPEENVRLRKDVADTIAKEPEGTGNLERDVNQVKQREAAEDRAAQSAKEREQAAQQNGEHTGPERNPGAPDQPGKPGNEPGKAGPTKPKDAPVNLHETGPEGSIAPDGSRRTSPEQILRQHGMSPEEIELVKGAMTKNAQESQPHLNNEHGPNGPKEPLTQAEKDALIKAHDILLRDVQEGQSIRKFVPNDKLGELLHGETVRNGQVVPNDKIAGDIALPRNSEGMNHEQTVHQVGLDYEHNPSGGDRGKQGQYTDVDQHGKVSVSQEVMDNGLHYLEMPMSAAQADAAQVPLARDLYEHAQQNSENPDQFKPKDREGHADNPYTGTGMTSPNALNEFQAAINQELNAGVHAIVDGAQLKVRGDVAGADQTVATFNNGRWELSPDLTPQQQAYYQGLIDSAQTKVQNHRNNNGGGGSTP